MADLDSIVEEFAESVAAQAAAMHRGDAKTGNKHAKRYISAFHKLCAHGDSGREALTQLFNHERADVRTMAAAFLLRYRTDAARAVLQAVASDGKGVAAFGAAQTLKNWENGTWALDPP